LEEALNRYGRRKREMVECLYLVQRKTFYKPAHSRKIKIPISSGAWIETDIHG
jgi:hypothetical protein